MILRQARDLASRNDSCYLHENGKLRYETLERVFNQNLYSSAQYLTF